MYMKDCYKETSFLKYWDKNNLYEWPMSQTSTNSFKWF